MLNANDVSPEKILADAETVERWTSAEIAADVLKEDPSVRSFTGTSPAGRFFMVVSFDIERQGFDKGARGHDGTTRGGGVVMRLPRALAETIFGIAEKKAMA